MPQCLVRAVRSVDLVATNLDEAARFYETVWGLQPVEAKAHHQTTYAIFAAPAAIIMCSRCIAARSPR